MNGIDLIILLAVACLLYIAVRYIRRTAKKGGCAGCGGCSGGCPSGTCHKKEQD